MCEYFSSETAATIGNGLAQTKETEKDDTVKLNYYYFDSNIKGATLLLLLSIYIDVGFEILFPFLAVNPMRLHFTHGNNVLHGFFRSRLLFLESQSFLDRRRTLSVVTTQYILL